MTKKQRINYINENMRFFKKRKPSERYIKNIMSRFLFFNEDTAYCTYCESEVKKPALLKHNENSICPCCKSTVIAKNLKYSHKKLEDVQWSLIVENVEGYILFRYYRHIRNLADYKNTDVKTLELHRDVLNISTKERHFFSLYNGEWCKYRNYINHYCQSSVYSEPQNGCHVPANLSKTISKQIPYLKETSDIFFSEGLKYDKEGYLYETFVQCFLKYKYMEILTKVGLKHLLYSSYDSRPLINGNNPMEILGLSHLQYKIFMQQEKKSWNDINKIITISELMKFTEENYLSFKDYDKCQIEDILFLTNYMSKVKAKKMYDQYGTLYIDYIKMALKLGHDMTNKFVLFPANVKNAHDIVTGEINKQKAADAKKVLKEIKNAGYEFCDSEYAVIVPTSSASIVKEGQNLHHCVANYISDVVNRKTIILFVRKISNKRKSLYTLEVKDNKVRQFRAFGNKKPPEDAQKFIELYEQEILKKKIA